MADKWHSKEARHISENFQLHCAAWRYDLLHLCYRVARPPRGTGTVERQPIRDQLTFYFLVPDEPLLREGKSQGLEKFIVLAVQTSHNVVERERRIVAGMPRSFKSPYEILLFPF